MSSPNEIKALRVVKELENPTKRAVAEAMEVSEDYAGYLLQELASRGFLEKVEGSFYLTQKGRDELLFTLYHIQGRLRAKIYRAARQEKRTQERVEELKAIESRV